MTAILFFLVLSSLVLAHELGHFLVARFFGIKAHEFGIGFPPRIFGYVREGKKWKKISRQDTHIYKNTIISINYLPFGGFVKIKGEDAQEKHDTDSILSKPMYQRMLVVSAGVMMNWLMAIILLTIVFTAGVETDLYNIPISAHITNKKIVASEILPNAPADIAGMKMNDSIRTINGHAFANAEMARDLIRDASKVGPVFIEWSHHSEHLIDDRVWTANIAPVEITEIKTMGIGIALVDRGVVSFSFPESIIQAVFMTAHMTWTLVAGLGSLVKNIFVTHHVTQDVSGPVGIAVMTGEAARMGFISLLQFAAMLSINLAVVNILPIPALDGGRLLFMIIEKIRRKPMNIRFETGVHNIAFMLLILLVIFVSVRDVARLTHVFGM